MAENRENTLLQAIAEGESVDNARTADEVFLKAIADGTEKPEEIRNRLQYWLNQIDGGGGNPNYVETITGTLENPWGNNNPENLFGEVRLNNATIILTFDGGKYVFSIDDLAFVYANVRSNGVSAAVEIKYKESGAFQKANDESGPIDRTTPCTLTIIHHPLPTT